MKLLIFTFLSATFIQIGINFVNDALDFCKGADTEERLGPDRVTQKGWLSLQQVLGFGFIFLLAGLFLGIPLMIKGGYAVMGILVLCVVLGYFYTGGPYPLSYLGLGELFVLLFFGFVATTIPYYVQTLAISVQVILAGFQIGCLACILLLINNLRDIQTDAKAKKHTTAVRFGKSFARIELTVFILLPFAANLIWIVFARPWAAFLPFITIPLAIIIIKKIWSIEPGRIYNQYLGMSALLHCLFGTLLALGIIL